MGQVKRVHEAISGFMVYLYEGHIELVESWMAVAKTEETKARVQVMLDEVNEDYWFWEHGGFRFNKNDSRMIERWIMSDECSFLWVLESDFSFEAIGMVMVLNEEFKREEA